MLWPVGQPDGYLYERAMNSRSIWKKVLNDANLWYDEVGSLHAAYNGLESQVLTQARRFEALSVETSGKTIDTLPVIDTAVRPLTKLAAPGLPEFPEAAE